MKDEKRDFLMEELENCKIKSERNKWYTRLGIVGFVLGALMFYYGEFSYQYRANLIGNQHYSVKNPPNFSEYGFIFGGAALVTGGGIAGVISLDRRYYYERKKRKLERILAK